MNRAILTWTTVACWLTGVLDAGRAYARTSPVCGEPVEFDFSGTMPFAGEYHGLFFTEGEVIGATVDIQFTTLDNFDAADVIIAFQLIDATDGVAFGFHGSDVGWSGQGTFTLKVPTKNFNGLLFHDDNPWGGYLFTFTGLLPGNPPKGTLDRAVYTLEFGPCPIGDVNHDISVNVDDLLAVIIGWGQCPAPPEECAADINGDLAVNVDDLLAVISNWHPWCPKCQ